MRLALGTVQFGMDYGVSNEEGKVKLEEVKSILSYARKSGIDTLDTAISYGDSEEVLGNIDVSAWKVITKLPSVPDEVTNISEWVNTEINSSFQRLGVSAVEGLLLHNPGQLLSEKGKELYQSMSDLKQQKKIEKIGVSVYSPDELDMICSNYDIDVVQAPFNIIDRRLLDSGWMEKLKTKDIEIHVRSVMLQGLLFMITNTIPDKFKAWDNLWKCWRDFLAKSQLTPLQAALGYVLSHQDIDKVIVGVDNKKQLVEITQAASSELTDVPDELHSEDGMLINPSNWQFL